VAFLLPTHFALASLFLDPLFSSSCVQTISRDEDEGEDERNAKRREAEADEDEEADPEKTEKPEALCFGLG
jgi:hypothetical protein